MNATSHLLPSTKTFKELTAKAAGMGISSAGVYFTCKYLTCCNPKAAAIYFIADQVIKSLSIKIIQNFSIQQIDRRIVNLSILGRHAVAVTTARYFGAPLLFRASGAKTAISVIILIGSCRVFQKLQTQMVLE